MITDHIQFLLNDAQAARRDGQEDIALQAYDKAIAQMSVLLEDSEHDIVTRAGLGAGVYVARALLLRTLEQIDPAFKDINEAVRLVEMYELGQYAYRFAPEAYFYRGNLRAIMSDDVGAEKDYVQVVSYLQIAPVPKLGWVVYDDLRLAVGDASLIQSPQAVVVRAWAHATLNDWINAHQDIRRFPEVAPPLTAMIYEQVEQIAAIPRDNLEPGVEYVMVEQRGDQFVITYYDLHSQRQEVEPATPFPDFIAQLTANGWQHTATRDQTVYLERR